MRVHRWHRAIDVLDKAGVWRYCFGGGEEFQSMDPQVEARLREHFRPEVEALEEFSAATSQHGRASARAVRHQ